MFILLTRKLRLSQYLHGGLEADHNVVNKYPKFYFSPAPMFLSFMPVLLKVGSPEGISSMTRELEMQTPRLHPGPSELESLGVKAQPSVTQHVFQVVMVHTKSTDYCFMLHCLTVKKKEISWFRYQKMTAELVGFLISL